MSIFLYRFDCPGNGLDGETFDVQATDRATADGRAIDRVRNTYAWSTRTDARAVFVASYSSRQAMTKAEESGVRLNDTEVDAVLDVCLGRELAK